MSKNTSYQNTSAINIICEGTQVVGDITTNGEIRIDGALEGNLNAKGKVVIGSTGKVKGQVVCKNCDVQGKVEGKIEVGQLLSLKSSSNFQGNILTHQLGIEPGAKFNGNCKMNGKAEPSAGTAGKKQ